MNLTTHPAATAPTVFGESPADDRHQPACIHELFERQAWRTPQALAVATDRTHLTYSALDTRANQLAHYLRARGVGPECIVGICLEPSVEAAIAVLGIIKAGGANLTLPCDGSAQRFRDFVRGADVRLVVTTNSVARQLTDCGAAAVCIDAELEGLAQLPSVPVSSGVTVDNAAFVRYTSGSTGEPKAVLNTHRSLTSRLIAGRVPDIASTDICGLNTTLGFGMRFFYPLALGATVVILRDDQMRDPWLLLNALQRSGLTSIYLVPSLLRQLLAAALASNRTLPAVRALSVGGEPLTPDIIERFWRVMPNASLINLYGGTEIGSTAALRVVPQGAIDNRCVLGESAPNTNVYVVNAQAQEVEPNTVGEIAVTSTHLARGYLGRPGLTATRFVPDFLSGARGGRMYRTGDLGRRLPNRTVEFLGREDHQVKVGGHRVELGEIEAALLTHADVHAAAVVTARRSGDTVLIAYASPKTGRQVRGVTLREHLQRQLPSHMLPSGFVVLDTLPLTHSAKIDRMALPPVDDSRPADIGPYEAPRSAIETRLVAIWEAIFEIASIGIHDGFIDLGGTSLLAARAVARVCSELGVELPVSLLFELSTIAALAPHVDASRPQPVARA